MSGFLTDSDYIKNVQERGWLIVSKPDGTTDIVDPKSLMDYAQKSLAVSMADDPAYMNRLQG